MKLAKKVLACVVAFALMSVLAISAFAEGPAELVVKASATTVEVGQTVTLTASIANSKGLMSAALIMKYNPDSFELVNVKALTVEGALPAAGVETPGEATCALAFTESNEAASIDVFTVTLKALKDTGVETITLDILDGDFDGVAAPSEAGVAQIKFVEKATQPTPSETESTPAPSGSDESKTTKPEKDIPKTGDAGIAVAAGLVVLAGAAFVASKKSK